MPGHNLFRRLEPLFPFPEYKPKLGLYTLPATWILYLQFFRRSCNMCARTSLLKEVRITVFILVPPVSVVSFFDLQFCRIRRATSPVTSPSSPYAAPLSLNRRTISSMVSSPIPASSKRVLSPKFLKNSSVFSMVSDTRTLGTPEVTPQIRSPYCSILSRFFRRRVSVEFREIR